MFNIFSKPPPPPPKKWYTQPALILTMIAMFVLAPVGAIYNGMTEELKKKADNKTVILLIQQLKEDSDRQWKEIDRNRDRSEQKVISAPKNVEITGPRATIKRVEPAQKPVLTPEQFEKYLSMKPEIKVKYKKYLESRGYDIEGLP
jgi:hypothetical protein